MSSPIIWGPTGATNLTNSLTTPGSTSGALTLQPAASTTSYSLVFPPAQGGAGTSLQNDGSGNLSWATYLANLFLSAGDLLVGDVAGDPARLPIGIYPNQVLTRDTSTGDSLGWRTPPLTKNYIGNYSFESNSTSGWSLFNTTLTGVIPTGSISAGASSITTFATTGLNPLGGTYSLDIGTSSTFTAGQGFITDQMTFDNEDRAQVISFSFRYQVVAGAANMNFSGTSSNTFAVYLYDGNGGGWIQPAGVYNMIQSSGYGICSGTFQTGANSTSFRLAVICVNSSTGSGAELYFDDFYLGPQNLINGAAVSDWVAYASSITASPTNPTLGTFTGSSIWRRVGDSMEILFEISQTSSGSNGSGSYMFSIPSGYSIDLAKYNGLGGATGTVGVASADDASANYSGWTSINNSTTLMMTVGANGSATNVIGSSFLGLGGSTIRYSFTALVPIVGWSSNTVMSNDTDTRVVSLCAVGSSTNIADSTSSRLAFTTVEQDTHGAFDAASGIYTIPVSGFYQMAGTIDFSSNSSGLRYVQVGGQYSANISNVTPLNGDRTFLTYTYQNYFIAGQQLYPEAYQTSGTTLTAGSATALYINRLSGPATIAASDTVAASYYLSGTVGSTSGTPVTITYNNKEFDTTDSYNTSTGVYTVPISGKYLVNGAIEFAGNSSGNRELRVVTSGSTSLTITIGFIAAYSGGSLQLQGAGKLLNLIAGDTVTMQAFQSSGGSLNVGANGQQYDFFSIHRIGN